MSAGSLSAGQPTSCPLRVLVVDDNPDAADSLGSILKLWDIDCEITYDGNTGLQRACEYRPNFVLLDLNMPILDGYAVAQKLREKEELKGVRIIAVTAFSDAKSLRCLQEAGFDDYYLKTADLQQLKNLLMGVGRIS